MESKEIAHLTTFLIPMSNQIDRRNFISSSAAAGAGLMLANGALGQAGNKKDINIALIGAGTQGQVLMNAIL